MQVHARTEDPRTGEVHDRRSLVRGAGVQTGASSAARAATIRSAVTVLGPDRGGSARRGGEGALRWAGVRWPSSSSVCRSVSEQKAHKSLDNDRETYISFIVSQRHSKSA